jgi:hypothetical protein
VRDITESVRGADPKCGYSRLLQACTESSISRISIWRNICIATFFSRDLKVCLLEHVPQHSDVQMVIRITESVVMKIYLRLEKFPVDT